MRDAWYNLGFAWNRKVSCEIGMWCPKIGGRACTGGLKWAMQRAMERGTLASYFTALEERDASYDGVFYAGVSSTGIFCRPSCPARKPKRAHVRFFATAREALAAGFRPCLRCKPMEAPEATPKWVRETIRAAETSEGLRLSDAQVRARGVDPTRLRRWFKQHHGMTFQAYLRMRRVGIALGAMKNGTQLTEAGLASGYESLSGFREAVKQTTGRSAGRSKAAAVLYQIRLETPLGPMLAMASEGGLVLLEFGDRRMLETHLKTVERRWGDVILPGENAHLKQTREELAEYFAGERQVFSLTYDLRGTDFQERVWRGLMRIPYGETRSYGEQAQALGEPRAIRAVARANGENRLAIVIPCHRVIGSDGKLVGYGGGLERKKWLLNHERTRTGLFS